MTPKKVRATLRKHFCDAGFAEDGPRLIRQSQELTHCVEVTAVRGLSGSIQIHHHVSLTGQAQPLLSEELASHGHHSTFPRIWSAASVDERLVLDQVTAICRSFQTRQDLVHFFSDRYQRSDELGLPGTLPPAPINSLSAAEASRALQRLAREILNEYFSLVPSPLCFPRKSLQVTPKQVFFSSGRSLLLPMTTPPSNADMLVRTELNKLVEQPSAHAICAWDTENLFSVVAATGDDQKALAVLDQSDAADASD